jgi:hypothetical protein
MGYNLFQWKFLNKSFRAARLLDDDINLPLNGILMPDQNYYGKKMLELGCQVMRDRIRKSLKSKGTSRTYFKSIGIDCISVDKKGCLFSRKIDLREDINNKYHDRFDIITNFGTTEHILPLEGQYQAFKNIHSCAKTGSIMIHFLPGIGKYYGHCRTYYDYKFFESLAKLNNYDIVLMEPAKKRKNFLWIGVCMVKKYDTIFSSDREKFFKYIEFIDKKTQKDHQDNKKKYI